MGKLITQIRELPPSAKEPLFRRLISTENLSYLKDGNNLIGFEVDTKADQELSGFTLIGIQKHTIYAYCSDPGEPPRLVLFPSLEKLFDPEFGLLNLQVTKRLFHDSTFRGKALGSGKFKELVRDLTPPEKQVDVPASVLESMAEHMKSAESGTPTAAELDRAEEVPVKVTKEVVVEEEPETFTEEPDYVDGDPGYVDEEPQDFSDYESGFSDYDGGYADYEPELSEDSESPTEPEPEIPAEDSRSTQLKAQAFASLPDVTDFCANVLHVNRSLCVTLVNRALQSPVAPEDRIALAVKLFCKLFDEKRI